MIDIVFGQDDLVVDFVDRLTIRTGRGFGQCSTLGFAKGGKLIAGVIYHSYDPEAGVIEISSGSTSRMWTTKGVIRAIFSYPFDQLGMRMVVARISESNARTRRIWAAFGADEHVIPGLRGPNEAEIVATLTAEKWKAGKFERNNNG